MKYDHLVRLKKTTGFKSRALTTDVYSVFWNMPQMLRGTHFIYAGLSSLELEFLIFLQMTLMNNCSLQNSFAKGERENSRILVMSIKTF